MAENDPAPEGIPIKTLLNSVNPINWFTTAKQICREKPDLLIVRFWLPFMGPALGTVIRQVKKRCKTHVVAVTDNVIPHEKRAFDKPFTNWFLKGCDSFVAMAQSVAEDLKGFGIQGPVAVTPHPVYDIFGAPMEKAQARAQLGIASNQKTVLFFGFIRPYKGLDLLIKCFSQNKLLQLDIKLIIAGEFYDNKQPYLDLIASLGLQNRVLLHDQYIPKEEVKKYFCAADIVAQPYRTATQSGVTQIAYHFGRPMLVTRVGGLPEMVPHGQAGYVTEPDPESIAEALADFFENNRMPAMELFVQSHKATFTWSAFASNLLRNAGF